ncbi:TetR/AcrR family transcriptional regulator [Ciceribacter sp. L1K22]|uniref:acrylate utilization transcriptional regulator AcuR n=1 Tax=Ciceribacter sp. L1K22 TaxID=2820275 RepID=UPI001ABEC190|nr:TetR/AcrR family transcriptional regulator [Ciceribacter sp. L1K22]MBO3759089.1 TetR family transcriptional regulator C-terminal domain-containing protein [Ciceribacter sp. L1K22]
MILIEQANKVEAGGDQPRKRGRPPRDIVDAEVRRRLVRSGLIFLTERGYSPVGLDEILRHAGVPKGGFYHYFSSKADFGRVLIAAYHAYFAEKLDRWFLDESLSPLSRLRAFVADAEQGMARHDFRRGCLIGNLGQEMGALPEEFRDLLVSALDGWQSRTARCLRTAQAEGEIASRHDPNALAAFFWIGWEGAVLRAKLERRADPLSAFADGFFAMLT